MSGYLEILRSPAGRMIVISGVARLGWGVVGLALIVHVQQAADSYAAAGLATGAYGIGSGLLAPLRGVVIDRAGAPALLAMGIAEGAILLVIAFTAPAGPGALSYVLLAALAGVVPPPFTAWTRAGLGARLDGAVLRGAYTVDNVLEEAAFVLGPLVAGVVIGLASPAAALVVAAALVIGGVLGLTVPRSVAAWAPPARRRESASRRSLNRPLLLAIVSLGGLGAGVGLVEVAVVAFSQAEGSQASAGLILGALSAGGVVGALVYGARNWRSSIVRRYTGLLVAMGAGFAALSLPGSIAGMVGLIAVVGLAFTPIFVTNSLLIERFSPDGPTTAAFTGVTAAMNGGVAIGAAVGGGVVDGGDVAAAFLLAGGAVWLGALVAAALPAAPVAEGGVRGT